MEPGILILDALDVSGARECSGWRRYDLALLSSGRGREGSFGAWTESGSYRRITYDDFGRLRVTCDLEHLPIGEAFLTEFSGRVSTTTTWWYMASNGPFAASGSVVLRHQFSNWERIPRPEVIIQGEATLPNFAATARNDALDIFTNRPSSGGLLGAFLSRWTINSTAACAFAFSGEVDKFTHGVSEHTPQMEFAIWEGPIQGVAAGGRAIQGGTLATQVDPEGFAADVANLPYKFGPAKRKSREKTVLGILESGRPTEYIESALRALLSTSAYGRLDDAIDILSQLGPTLEQFVQDSWTRHPPGTVDDDYWYVLIRALGQGEQTHTSLGLINLASRSWNRTLREAAAEALGDINTPWAVQKLREMAKNDSSEFIRDLASENLGQAG